MDTTVTGIGSVVVGELRAAGYMESTIGQYEKTIKALTCFVEERGSTYTPSLGVAFASMTVSPRTGRFSAQRRFGYGRLVSVFDSYVSTGRVDLSCRKRGGGGARPDSSEFTALAAAWEADMDDRGQRSHSRDQLAIRTTHRGQAPSPLQPPIARRIVKPRNQSGNPASAGRTRSLGLTQGSA